MTNQVEKKLSKRKIVFISGLSGAGKSSILRVLEDLGYEGVDNGPLQVLESIVEGTKHSLAIGVDTRTSGFSAQAVLRVIQTLRSRGDLDTELIFAIADKDDLLSRYTQTRRRHPLAVHGNVVDAIEQEIILTLPLHDSADYVIDTSSLPLPELRLMIEKRYRRWKENETDGLTITFVSFAFRFGIPKESDMVFDARFLKNPYYEDQLRNSTGADSSVFNYIAADHDFLPFLDRIENLLELVLPRFVQEGKKYATISVGCSGGWHRSVAIVEALSGRLAKSMQSEKMGFQSPIAILHRELSRNGIDHWRWANR